MTAEVRASTPYALLGGEQGMYRRADRVCALTAPVRRILTVRPGCTADRRENEAAGRA